MWQALYEELADRGLMIIAVAMDSREGAPDPWIREVAPTYVALVDREHRLADLYNMVNVPQAVWIDERGRIVRPTENAGAYEAFRARDPATGRVPEAEAAKAAQARATYYAALRDWVEKGEDSAFALDAEAARAHVPAMTEATALAHAHFRLGQHLVRAGKTEEGDARLREAARLHPDSWNMWRQWSPPVETGLAAGPEFWERVRALGDKRYYPLPDIPGMPE